MSEIFYRAWHRQRHQMFAVIGIVWTDACPSQLKEVILHGNQRVRPEEVVLMAYSGLMDKNKVYIYEGHRVKYNEGQGVVVYRDGVFSVDNQPLGQLRGLEVTGNIFEA